MFRVDGVTPAGDVPVIVYYEHLSQPGMAVPGQPAAGRVRGRDDEHRRDGSFSFDELVSGRLHVYAFDQGALSEGAVRFTLRGNGEREFASAAQRRPGNRARVWCSITMGSRCQGARVGGGLSLSTTNSSGQFTLTDVPDVPIIGARHVI